jgi:hypothetical protein
MAAGAGWAGGFLRRMAEPYVRPFMQQAAKGAADFGKHMIHEAGTDYLTSKTQEVTGVKVATPPPTSAKDVASAFVYQAGKHFLSQNGAYLQGKRAQYLNGSSTSPQIDKFVSDQESAAFKFPSDWT